VNTWLAPEPELGLTEPAVGPFPLTVNVPVPPWLSEPLVPVTLTVELPMVAVVVVLIVSVVEPEPVTEVGLKVPVTPVGNPDTPKFTAPLKPLRAVVETVYDVLPPATTVWDVGDTRIE
jgi:hypothetical protein